MPSITNSEMTSKTAWVDDGFSKWANGPERMTKHASSKLHNAAIKGLANYKGPTIALKMDMAHKKIMESNRIALSKIFSTICLLGQQGLPLRGDGNDENSNLIKFLKTRAEDVPELTNWLNSDGRYKWITHEIQNEILSMLSNKIVQDLVDEVREADFFSILLDETPDCSSREQLSICVRIVSTKFIVSEYFLGFYNVSHTTADALLEAVKDVFLRLQFDMSKLRGQCYDGASNMSGRHNGLQSKILAMEPRALYVHCNAHNLNLVVQDSISGVPWTRDNIGMAKDIIKFVRDSPKRLFEFKEKNTNTNLKAFNPTR